MRDQAKRIFAAAVIVSAALSILSPHDAFAIDGAAQAVNFINGVAKLLTAVAGALAIVSVIAGGIYYVTSGGKFERADKAKSILLHVGIGLVIVFAASVAVGVITDLAKSSFTN